MTAELEQRLIDEAGRHGIPPDQFVVQVLEQHLPMNDRREQFAALLQSWLEEDQEEQKDTFEYLLRSLDEDRPSQRKLFPPALKGISW
ncbi:MAG: hypothetical protein ABSG68_12870 [Thermoguttaceae bacterium]